MLEITQERVKTKLEPKLKGRLKDSKNRVYTLNPKFNRETYQQIKCKLNTNIAFYTIYTAGLVLLIYNDPETIEEAMKRSDWLEWKKAIRKEY